MNKKTEKKLEQLLDKVGDIALRRRARLIIKGLELQKGDKVLDVGCGDGFYLHLLSNLGLDLKLYGSDFDQNALKSAKIVLHGKNIPLTQADLMKKLPYRENFFDKIVMSEVAEHLPNDLKGLKEVNRVLKPGGILCITVPNARYPLLWDPVNKIRELFFGNHFSDGFWAGIWYGHIRLYNKEELEKVVSKANFKVVNSQSVTFWCLPFNHNIVNLGARILYSGNLSEKIQGSLSKYNKKPEQSGIAKLAFGVFRVVDSINDLYQPNTQGVGVFIKAKK